MTDIKEEQPVAPLAEAPPPEPEGFEEGPPEAFTDTEQAASPAEIPQVPQFMTEEQLRSFKVVDIIGNGDSDATLVLSSEQGIPITNITAVTFIFAVRPMAVKIEVAIGQKEEPDEKGRKLLDTVEVVYAVGRLMLCSNPRLVRMKHRGSKEWSLIAEFMDRLGNAKNTYYAVMEAMRRLRAVTTPPQPEGEGQAEPQEADSGIKIEVADVQVNPASQAQLES